MAHDSFSNLLTPLCKVISVDFLPNFMGIHCLNDETEDPEACVHVVV